MKNNQLSTIEYLFLRYFDGTIQQDELKRLEEIMLNDATVQEYFFEHVMTFIALKQCKELNIGSKQDVTSYQEELGKLAMYEKVAPAVKKPKTKNKPEQEFVPSAECEKLTFTLKKSSLISIITTIAAILFIVLVVRFIPPKSGIEVATLSDSINAKWADLAGPTEAGARLATSYTPLLLKEGLVKILFDNQAMVVIEAPAEFEVSANDRISLHYGRLYATVPQEAIGFIVSTQNSKVIDLGTEFGVEVTFNGTTLLHVIQGKTTLVSNKISQLVTEGFAKKIDGGTSAISDILCNKKLFARDISSQDQLVWRGQNAIDLADVIGGDGLNNTPKQTKIDLLTGQYTNDLVIPFGFVNPGFKTVKNPFIDGVFIPRGGVGQIISSTGLCFKECPETSNYAYYNISTLETVFEPAVEKNSPLSLLNCPLSLYRNDSSGEGIVFLHANAGITFDLSAIRNHLSGFQLTAFSTHYGFPALLPDVMTGTYPDRDLIAEGCATVDFCVLVDGTVRQYIKNITLDTKPAEINIPLSNQDRFLSLVVTDGNRKTLYDWFVLENAKIHIRK